jgi:hypothetical protein
LEPLAIIFGKILQQKKVAEKLFRSDEWQIYDKY